MLVIEGEAAKTATDDDARKAEVSYKDYLSFWKCMLSSTDVKVGAMCFHCKPLMHCPDLCYVSNSFNFKVIKMSDYGGDALYIVACQRGGVSNEPPGQRQDTGPGILWSVHRWTRPTGEPPTYGVNQDSTGYTLDP